LQPQPTTERNVSAPGANSVAGDGYVRQIALGKCIINRNEAPICGGPKHEIPELKMPYGYKLMNNNTKIIIKVT